MNQEFSDVAKSSIEVIFKHCPEMQSRKDDDELFSMIADRLEHYTERIGMLITQIEKRDKEIVKLKKKAKSKMTIVMGK